MKRISEKKSNKIIDKRRNKEQKKKILFLQIMGLFICLGIVLVIANFFRQKLSDHTISKMIVSTEEETKVSLITESFVETIPETTITPTETTEIPLPETEPTLPEPTELLPENPVAEAYFGTLPVASRAEPLRSFEARAIYIGMLGFDTTVVDFIRDTHINSVVIDLKESDGVKFNTKNQLAHEIDAVYSGAIDLRSVIEQYHAEDIKVIGRIVCFKDPLLAEKEPDRSIKGASGTPLLFSNEDRKNFINPYDVRNWEYNIELALEAVEAGVDEIQFDYVRFPVGNTTTGERPYFGEPDVTPEKYEVIDRFLQTARIRIQDEYGVPLSADVFGIILSGGASGDNLGQNWETVGLTGISAVCPMVYPSHYALNSGLNGHTFPKPDLQPYEVIYHALLSGKDIADTPGFSVVRPYLQAFTASWIGSGNYLSPYRYEHINAQIKAVYDAGYKEWILWNPGAYYPEGVYDGVQ